MNNVTLFEDKTLEEHKSGTKEKVQPKMNKVTTKIKGLENKIDQLIAFQR
jgi:hypothetical protein